jgi:hypothetical protein
MAATSLLVMAAAIAAVGLRADTGNPLVEARYAAEIALMRIFHPQARVREGGFGVVAPVGAEWKQLAVGAFQRGRPRNGLSMTWGSVEFMEEFDPVSDLAEQGRPLPAGGALRLVRALTNETGEVVDERHATVDSGCAAARALRIKIEEWPSDKEWPIVAVSYEAIYARSGYSVLISWASRVDMADLRMIERFPDGGWKRTSAGSETTEVFSFRREGNRIVLTARPTGRTFTYQCPEVAECIMPVEAVFGQ